MASLNVGPNVAFEYDYDRCNMASLSAGPEDPKVSRLLRDMPTGSCRNAVARF